MFYYIIITIFCYIVLLPLEVYYLTLNSIQTWCMICLLLFLTINIIITCLPHLKIYNTSNITKPSYLYGSFVGLIAYVALIVYLIVQTILTSNNILDLRHLFLISYFLSLVFNVMIIANFISKTGIHQSEDDIIQLTPVTKVVEVQGKELKQLKEDPTLSCAICTEIIVDPLTKELNEPMAKASSTCNHYFHKTCIMSWFKQKRNCPLCRAPLKPSFWV